VTPRLKLGWFHRYPARFAPEVLEAMLNGLVARLGRKPDVLLDPFAGVGTAVAAAVQLGISALGIEVFPLGVLIGQLRLAPPDPRAALGRAAELVDARKEEGPRGPNPLLERWLGQENYTQLGSYLTAIGGEPDLQVRRFLLVALSAALRASSRWLAGSIKAQIDPHRPPRPIGDQFLAKAKTLARDCRLETDAKRAPGLMLRGDAEALPIASRSVDAIISSPPYWVAYDYLSTQRLTYLAFGWPMTVELQIGRRHGVPVDGRGFRPPPALAPWYSFYGGERTGLGRSLREYVQRMRRHLKEVRRVIKPGGVSCYSIASSVRAGKRFDLVQGFVEMVEESGLGEVEVETREVTHRRILPLGRDSRTGRFSSVPTAGVEEALVYFRG